MDELQPGRHDLTFDIHWQCHCTDWGEFRTCSSTLRGDSIGLLVAVRVHGQAKTERSVLFQSAGKTGIRSTIQVNGPEQQDSFQQSAGSHR